MCIGSGGAGKQQAQDQLALQNKLTQQQLDQQAALRAQIMGGVGKYLTPQGQGFDPQQKAIMQAQFLDQNAAAGKQAGQNVLSSLAGRGGAGGMLPTGGDFARQLEGLQGTIATSQSQGILGTNLADLQQALTNRFNAASVASGQGAQLGQNIGTFNQGANNSLDQYVKAANAPGFLQSFGTALGGGLGMGFGGGIGASLGGLFPGSGGTAAACVMLGTTIIPLDSTQPDQFVSTDELPESKWIHLETKSGLTLDCTYDHPLFTSEKGKVRADTISVGDTALTRHGEDVVSSTAKFERAGTKVKTHMKHGHLFWANDFLSHNYKSA